MGRKTSVFNKRSNERVQSARTSGGLLPQAHAQSQNPTRNQSPQARTQSTQNDPWARANQFVQNVGRGGYDVGRSYTTDIADTVHAAATGREQKERNYEDETLATVFGRGLFEGNLEGSFEEASRRVQEQPGRVVGEVAAEAAILAGTMGFGAVAKGARIGYFATSRLPKVAKNYKSIRGASKADGSVGYTRKTGFLRKGTEEKWIGDKRTTINKTNRKGVTKRRVKKTNILDKLERFGIKHGERFGNKLGRPTRLGNPMIVGASGKVLGAADNVPIDKLNIDDIPGASITNSIATRNNPATAVTLPSKFTSQTVKLEKSFINYDQGVDPRFMENNAPVEQVFNQGEIPGLNYQATSNLPDISSITRIASFTKKDGSTVKATTLQELEALKSTLTKSDINKITYSKPKSISSSDKESILEGTANQINNNSIFNQSNSGIIDTSPSIVSQKVDDAILKASGEGKSIGEVVNIRNQYLNFWRQEAGRNTDISSPVLNIKKGVKVSDKDEIVSDTEEGVYFKTAKDTTEDVMGQLGSVEGDVGISSVGQITSRTGRFQTVGFRATGSKTEGGEQEAILNAFSPNAGTDLPFDLTVKPTSPYFTFSGTPDGIKPILRNIPGSSGSTPIDVEKRFTKMFLETNTPGQDFRRINIGATGSPKRTEFVNVLTSQLIKKNKADPNNPQTTKVYKQVAETMAEKSYNIPIDDWLKQTNTLKKDAINIKLRNEPGVQYNAMALIDGYGVTDVWRVKNKLTAVKKEYLRKSMKGKGETRLDTGDPLGGTNTPKTPYELYVKSNVRKELGIIKSEDDWIKKQAELGYTYGGKRRGKKMGIPEPTQPGNTKQNDPWAIGISQAERKAKLKANIKARKEALAKAPKAKKRRKSKRNAPASKSKTKLSHGTNWKINDPSDILRDYNIY